MENIIIIPTYNERKNVKETLNRIFETIPDISVLVVDDNSPDGTAEEVVLLKNKFPKLELLLRKKKEGLGKAYIEAFEKILSSDNYRTIIMMDCDLSHNPDHILPMLELSKSFDLVVGSRYVRGGKTEGWELWRKILSRCGNLYCKTVTRMPINDWTSGFNVVNTNFFRRIKFSDFDSSGYAFLIELKYALLKAGAKAIEYPILFKNRVGGESKISNHIISEGLLAPWKLVFKKNGFSPECKLCKNKKTKLLTHKNDNNIYKCSKCELLFVWPLPSNNSRIYSQDYFSGASKGFGYANYDMDKKSMRQTFNLYIDKIEELVHKKGGQILDIGTATGFFLEIAKSRNWRTAGVEISEWASEVGRKRGLDIRTGTLVNADFQQETFDAATMFDVIEHLTDPEIELTVVKKLLKNNGLLLINTPDTDSICAKLLNKYWYSLIPPEHLIYFNKRNLSNLLRKVGFEVIYDGKIPKKFTIQYCFKIAANWLKLDFLNLISRKLTSTRLGQAVISVNFRDNIFLIARKMAQQNDRT